MFEIRTESLLTVVFENRADIADGHEPPSSLAAPIVARSHTCRVHLHFIAQPWRALRALCTAPWSGAYPMTAVASTSQRTSGE